MGFACVVKGYGSPMKRRHETCHTFGGRPMSSRCAPFLVLAHHRSGSNFLNDVLQAHPALECLNEPLSMHTGLFRQCDLIRWDAKDYDPERLHASLAEEPELRGFLIELRSYLLQSTERRTVGFKETVLFGKLGWLQAFMPSLRIIFLRRDPRAIVNSVLRSGLMNFWRYQDTVPPVFQRLFPAYASQLRAHEHDALAAELVAMSVVVRYELARTSIGGFEHCVLPFEELLLNPAEELIKITTLLGVAPHPAPLSFMHERATDSRGGTFSSFRRGGDVANAWQAHLSPRQCQVIEEVLHAAGERVPA